MSVRWWPDRACTSATGRVTCAAAHCQQTQVSQAQAGSAHRPVGSPRLASIHPSEPASGRVGAGNQAEAPLTQYIRKARQLGDDLAGDRTIPLGNIRCQSAWKGSPGRGDGEPLICILGTEKDWMASPAPD